MEPTVARRPRFAAEDDGLASLSDAELGFSRRQLCHNVFSRSICSARGGFSLRNFGACSVSSPRSPLARFYDARFEDHQQHQHFLESCFLCKKPLGSNRDIFMYRGDTPFCSEECRQEQIDIDEAKEKNWNLSSSMKALKNRDRRKSNSATKAQDYTFHASTVAAA